MTSSIIPGSGKKKEDKIFDGIAIYLLPKVGASVSTLILSVSKTLSDQQVNVILAQVPNVRTVNLSYTCITSEAFDGLYKHNALRKLEDLQLQGWFHEFILKTEFVEFTIFFTISRLCPYQ